MGWTSGEREGLRSTFDYGTLTFGVHLPFPFNSAPSAWTCASRFSSVLTGRRAGKLWQERRSCFLEPGFLGKGKPSWGLVLCCGYISLPSQAEGPTHLRYPGRGYRRTHFMRNVEPVSPSLPSPFDCNFDTRFYTSPNDLVSASCPTTAAWS